MQTIAGGFYRNWPGVQDYGNQWGVQYESLSGLVDLGLGGLSAYQGAKAQGKADKMSQKALDLAERRYAELSPLRSKALSGLMNPETPDLSSIYAGSDNPFARPLGPLAPSMGATTPRGPHAMDPMERPMREVTMDRTMRAPTVSRLRRKV